MEEQKQFKIKDECERDISRLVKILQETGYRTLFQLPDPPYSNINQEEKAIRYLESKFITKLVKKVLNSNEKKKCSKLNHITYTDVEQNSNLDGVLLSEHRHNNTSSTTIRNNSNRFSNTSICRDSNKNANCKVSFPRICNSFNAKNNKITSEINIKFIRSSPKCGASKISPYKNNSSYLNCEEVKTSVPSACTVKDNNRNDCENTSETEILPSTDTFDVDKVIKSNTIHLSNNSSAVLATSTQRTTSTQQTVTDFQNKTKMSKDFSKQKYFLKIDVSATIKLESENQPKINSRKFSKDKCVYSKFRGLRLNSNSNISSKCNNSVECLRLSDQHVAQSLNVDLRKPPSVTLVWSCKRSVTNHQPFPHSLYSHVNKFKENTKKVISEDNIVINRYDNQQKVALANPPAGLKKESSIPKTLWMLNRTKTRPECKNDRCFMTNAPFAYRKFRKIVKPSFFAKKYRNSEGFRNNSYSVIKRYQQRCRNEDTGCNFNYKSVLKNNNRDTILSSISEDSNSSEFYDSTKYLSAESGTNCDPTRDGWDKHFDFPEQISSKKGTCLSMDELDKENSEYEKWRIECKDKDLRVEGDTNQYFKVIKFREEKKKPSILKKHTSEYRCNETFKERNRAAPRRGSIRLCNDRRQSHISIGRSEAYDEGGDLSLLRKQLSDRSPCYTDGDCRRKINDISCTTNINMKCGDSPFKSKAFSKITKECLLKFSMLSRQKEKLRKRSNFKRKKIEFKDKLFNTYSYSVGKSNRTKPGKTNIEEFYSKKNMKNRTRIDSITEHNTKFVKGRFSKPPSVGKMKSKANQRVFSGPEQAKNSIKKIGKSNSKSMTTVAYKDFDMEYYHSWRSTKSIKGSLKV